mgnify:CR=1 FL=1
MNDNKIILGITGASGSIYAQNIINKLLTLHDIKLDFIFSETAIKVWQHELGELNFKKFPFNIFNNYDFFAPPSSGSSAYDAMIICPCTMGTLGRVASGVSVDLISRSADVMLKERKKVIFVIREAPYNLIHIKNMEKITLAGGIIYPASPYFYSKPSDVKEMITTVTDRVLELAGIRANTFRWS